MRAGKQLGQTQGGGGKREGEREGGEEGGEWMAMGSDGTRENEEDFEPEPSFTLITTPVEPLFGCGFLAAAADII